MKSQQNRIELVTKPAAGFLIELVTISHDLTHHYHTIDLTLHLQPSVDVEVCGRKQHLFKTTLSFTALKGNQNIHSRSALTCGVFGSGVVEALESLWIDDKDIRVRPDCQTSLLGVEVECLGGVCAS